MVITKYSYRANMTENYGQEYRFKVIVIGDPDVGKSTLIACCTLNENSSVKTKIYRQPRVHTSHVVSKEGSRVRLYIHDTAGQERYRSLTRSFYRRSHGCFLVFDTRKQSSFDSLSSWIEELRFYAESQTEVLILGTNCCSVDRVVGQDALQNFASEQDLEYIEVDTECNINVLDVCEKMTSILLQKVKENVSSDDVIPYYSLKLNKPKLKDKIVKKICDC